MEAIKFSELPSGDRMQLQDEDGLPIIASQENRLLSWGRLKAQLATQTHTKTVEDDDAKVPTAKAVLTAVKNAESTATDNLATARSELTEQINDLRGDLDEKIDDVLGKAEGADATAKSALASAGAASRDAQSAENKVAEALDKANEAKTLADSMASTITTAQATADNALSKAEEAQNVATEIDPIKQQLTALKDAGDAQNSGMADLAKQIESITQQLTTAGNYTGWRVEITAGAVDSNSEMMTGSPTFSETVEGADEGILVSEAIALIFRNQEALYQILMDTRKRAIANATNLTVMLDEISKLLNQVVN